MTYTFTRGIRRTAPLVLVAAGLAVALAGCSGSSAGDAAPDPAASDAFNQELHDALPQSVQDAGVLKLGSPTTNAPYITKPAGEAEGMIPELATSVGEVLGVRVEIVETPFPGLVPALEANRIDAIWSVMNDTVEREKTLDMVDWIRTDSAFLVPAGNPKAISGIEDLCGANAGTLRGSAQAALLEEQSKTCAADGEKPVSILLYDDMGAGQTQLRAGKLDAYFGGTVPLTYLASQVDGGKAFEVAEKTYLGGVFAIAVEKGDPLAQSLLEALKEIEASGEYGKILASYDAQNDALTAEEFQLNGIGAGAFE